VILVGVPRKGKNVNIFSLPLHFGKVLSGSHGGEATPQIDIPRYHQLFCNGRIQLKNIITNFYSLEEINKALDGVRSGAIAGRCMISMPPRLDG